MKARLLNLLKLAALALVPALSVAHEDPAAGGRPTEGAAASPVPHPKTGQVFHLGPRASAIKVAVDEGRYDDDRHDDDRRGVPGRRNRDQPYWPGRDDDRTPPRGRPNRRPDRSPNRRPDLSPNRRPSRRPNRRPSRRPDRSPNRRPSRRPSRRPNRSPSRRFENRGRCTCCRAAWCCCDTPSSSDAAGPGAAPGAPLPEESSSSDAGEPEAEAGSSLPEGSSADADEPGDRGTSRGGKPALRGPSSGDEPAVE